MSEVGPALTSRQRAAVRVVPFVTGAIGFAVAARRWGEPDFAGVGSAALLVLAGAVHSIAWYAVLSRAKTTQRFWVFTFSLLSLPLSVAFSVVGLWVALVMADDWTITAPMGAATWLLMRACERSLLRARSG